MDEPTRGIDVGAKFEIYTIMADLAKQGKCIIMVSSEMPELLGMSDRVMVMYPTRNCDQRFLNRHRRHVSPVKRTAFHMKKTEYLIKVGYMSQN